MRPHRDRGAGRDHRRPRLERVHGARARRRADRDLSRRDHHALAGGRPGERRTADRGHAGAHPARSEERASPLSASVSRSVGAIRRSSAPSASSSRATRSAGEASMSRAARRTAGRPLRCRGWRQEGLAAAAGERADRGRRSGASWSSTRRSARPRATGPPTRRSCSALKDLDGGRDPDRAVGQADRRAHDARARAARAHGELQPRRPLGQRGGVLRPRAARPHLLGRSHGRLLAIHRLAGRAARHLRDSRARRGAPRRGGSARPVLSHRRTRRHGLRAAARRVDARRGEHHRRGRCRARGQASPSRGRRRRHGLAPRGARTASSARWPSVARWSVALVANAADVYPGDRGGRGCARTWSPIRPPLTICSTATCRKATPPPTRAGSGSANPREAHGRRHALDRRPRRSHARVQGARAPSCSTTAT